jgi:hypothetical protein
MSNAELALEEVRLSVRDSCTIDRYICNKRPRSRSEYVKTSQSVSLETVCDTLKRSVRRVSERCRQVEKKLRKESPPETHLDACAASASYMHRFSRRLELAPYLDKQMLHLVPKIVNVVTVTLARRSMLGVLRNRKHRCKLIGAFCSPQLSEVFPTPGSATTLPLDLRRIASSCDGAYYAPDRFAAVQLAFSSPKSRILIFREFPSATRLPAAHAHFNLLMLAFLGAADTGRVVGTGASGHMAARFSIAQAQHQMATQAGVFLTLKSFSVCWAG